MLVRTGGVGRVLDHGDDPAGHEPRGPDRGAGPGHLADLDDAATVGDLHAAARPGRRQLIRPGALAGVDHDLDAITLHRRPPSPGVKGGPGREPRPVRY